jgi:DNA polymerase-3 subunit alpha
MKALVTEREANGPFKDLSDFARRMDPKAINRRQLENLVKAGAFDSLEKNRARLFKGIEIVLRNAQAAAEERNSAQVNLFGGTAQPKLALPAEPEWPLGERLTQEFEAIGFYLSAHPMDAYATTLKRLNALKANEIAKHLRLGGQGRVKVAGSVLGKQELTSARGSRYAFLSMSDASGGFEVTLFSEVLGASRELLDSGQPLLLTVDARVEDEQLRLTCQAVESLDAAAAKTAAGLKIVLSDDSPIPALQNLIAREARGRGKIILVPRFGNREVEIALKQTYTISPQTIGALRTIPGVVEVMEI